jgi:regulatory protein
LRLKGTFVVNVKKTITAIKAGKNPKIQRSNIFLDGKFAFSLDNEVILKETLKVGGELSSDQTQSLSRTDDFQRCLNSAFRFLSYRPRSQSEIKERLSRAGYQIEDIEKVISKLKELNLVDDFAFAEYWKDNRNSFRPRSQRIVRSELRRKGVEPDVIQDVVEKIDDAENAYRVAVVRARVLPTEDFRVFREKLSGFLQRRGFDYSVTNKVIKRVWEELTGGRVGTAGSMDAGSEP